MKTIICLIRHGRTNQNIKKLIQGRKDFPLSEEGKNDALKTAKYLKENDSNWDVIYSSPLSRAFDTASIIAKEINYNNKIKIDNDFIEREFGVAEGLPITKENFEKVLDNSWEGIEKDTDIGIRIRHGISKISQKYEGKKILIVTHSHAIKGMLKSIDNTISMDRSLNNCSMTYLIYENDEYYIKEIGKIPE